MCENEGMAFISAVEYQTDVECWDIIDYGDLSIEGITSFIDGDVCWKAVPS